jgi:hypothetical protein
MGDALARTNGSGALTARDEMSGKSMERVEAGVSVLQASATAEVQARYVMAYQRPRDYDTARVRLMRACQRGGFAEQALYAKPIGGGKVAEGLSIRFAEEAERSWGNLFVGKTLVSNEPEQEIWRVWCVDLEANVTESEDVLVEKTVEQTFVRDGQAPIGMRMNSYGKPTYLYPADEGRLITKRRAALSKSKRAVVLANIPGEIQDECKAAIRRTRAEGDNDPTAARRKLVDAFAGINVMPGQLQEYLEHPVDQVTPAEMDDLRGIYAGLKSGDIESWAEVMSGKRGDTADKPKEKDAATAAAKAAVRAKVSGKKAPADRGSDRGEGALSPEDEAKVFGNSSGREPGDD